jgi:uncharacterized membrane protein YeaQ/YmgE (transglycosylase-associated protein family)
LAMLGKGLFVALTDPGREFPRPTSYDRLYAIGVAVWKTFLARDLATRPCLTLKNGGTFMLFQLLVLLLIAGVCGALGQAIGGYSHGGCLVSIALGFIGALLGSWIAGQLHLPELVVIPVGGTHFPVIWSIIGAALFVALINLISRRRA